MLTSLSQIVVLDPAPVLASQHRQDVDVASIRSPSRYVKIGQVVAIEDYGKRSGGLVIKTSDAKKRTQFAQRSCDPIEIGHLPARNDVHVLGRSACTVQAHRHTADDKELNSMTREHFDDSRDVERRRTRGWISQLVELESR